MANQAQHRNRPSQGVGHHPWRLRLREDQLLNRLGHGLGLDGHEPPYLVAASLDEGLRRPLVDDDDQVVIKGVVLPHRLRPGVPLPAGAAPVSSKVAAVAV